MIAIVSDHYLWVKAFHIIAVISWMAGMLYLPRLYVYHVDAPVGSAQSETFKVMERKLLRFIINPAMIASWVLGLSMLMANPGLMQSGWMHAKLTALLLMQIFHACLARWRRAFANDKNIHTAKFYRQINEIPTILMIVIVIMVVVKPF